MKSSIIKAFFKAFKENFKQSTGIWLILLAVAIIIALDFFLIAQLGSEGYMMIVQYILFAALLIYAMVLAYVFPILSKFENTVKNTLKNALLMSIKHLKWTILILIITYVPIALTILFTTILTGPFIWLFIGFSLVSFDNSFIIVRILITIFLVKRKKQIQIESNNKKC